MNTSQRKLFGSSWATQQQSGRISHQIVGVASRTLVGLAIHIHSRPIAVNKPYEIAENYKRVHHRGVLFAMIVIAKVGKMARFGKNASCVSPLFSCMWRDRALLHIPQDPNRLKVACRVKITFQNHKV